MFEVKEINMRKPSNTLIRAQEGWMFQWMTPKNPANIVIPVVPGPFLRPKLVQVLPYVITDNSSNNAMKFRDGIPDPWIEYLAWRNIVTSRRKTSIPQDARMAGEYQRFTDYIWNQKGLAMVQGIPDPWKNGQFLHLKLLHN
jgi:hypothetical protein